MKNGPERSVQLPPSNEENRPRRRIFRPFRIYGKLHESSPYPFPKYAPYSKWLFRSTVALPKFDELAIAVRNIAEGKNITENIEIACAAVRAELKAQQISNSDDYMSACADDAKHRADIIYTAEEIIAMEWDFFDKVQNEGGRADCQDDYYTFP